MNRSRRPEFSMFVDEHARIARFRCARCAWSITYRNGVTSTVKSLGAAMMRRHANDRHASAMAAGVSR